MIWIPIISCIAKNTRKFDNVFIVRVSLLVTLVSCFWPNFSTLKPLARRNPDSISENSVNASFELHENRVGFLRTDARESLAALDRSIDRHYRFEVRLSRLDRESPVLERLREWDEKKEEDRERIKERQGQGWDRVYSLSSLKWQDKARGREIWRAKRREIILDFSTVAMWRWISYLLGLTRVKRKSISSIRPRLY